MAEQDREDVTLVVTLYIEFHPDKPFLRQSLGVGGKGDLKQHHTDYFQATRRPYPCLCVILFFIFIVDRHHRWHAMMIGKGAMSQKDMENASGREEDQVHRILLPQPNMQKGHLSLSPCSGHLAGPDTDV